MKFIKRNYEKGYHDSILYREAQNSQRNQARLGALLEYRQAGRLLEIGCGQAGFLGLAENHFEVEGMDVSRSAIESIRPHFGERVSVVNVEQRPLPRDRFDAIVVFNILEHLRQPHKVVDKLYHALSDGGVMIGSVPNHYGPVGEVVTHIGNFFDRTHVSVFNPETWGRIFKHAGFGETTFFGEVTIGRNRCRYLRGRLWPYLSFNLMFVCEKKG